MEARKEHTETTKQTTETVDKAATAAVPVVAVDPDAASVTGSAALDEAIADQAEHTATAGKVTVEKEQ